MNNSLTTDKQERMVLSGEAEQPYRSIVLNLAVSGNYVIASMTTVTSVASMLLIGFRMGECVCAFPYEWQ